MTISVDISNQYLSILKRQSITYYQVSADGVVSSGSGGSFDASFDNSFDIGTGATITGSALKRENKKGSDFIATGNVETAYHRAIWEVFRASLSSDIRPKRGDYFYATNDWGESQKWVVMGVDYSTHQSRYRLSCFLEEQDG